jgi:hypothetical protein
MGRRWTNDLLDPQRQLGDPDADDLVRKLFEASGRGGGERPHAVQTLFDTLVGRERPLGSALPGDVLRFLTRDPLPAWADPVRLRHGQEVFERYGPLVVIALFCSSLPRAYLARKGVQVLNLTAYLSQDPRRRVVETAQMVIDAMTPGGLQPPGGFGISSAQKVRVMHAAIRFLIQDRLTWNAQELGVPINQEDLAGTLCTFSIGVLQALERFGVRLSRSEAEDYLHAWKVVAHILGVGGAVMPDDVADATELAERIAERHFEVSLEGRHMMNALTQLMRELTPWRLFDGLPSSTVRFLIGDAHADLLGVPRADWTRHLVRGLCVAAGAFDRWTDGSPVHQRLGEWFGGALLRGLLEMERGSKPDPFRIPANLRWYVERRPKPRPVGRLRRLVQGTWRALVGRLRGWWRGKRGG